MVARKPDHQGEREVSRKTIARGMPGEPATCGGLTRVFSFFTHEAADAHGAPGIPCALSMTGDYFRVNLARIARRDRDAMSSIWLLFDT